MTEKPSNVRLATPHDNQKIYDVLCKLYEENGAFSIDPIKVMRAIEQATNNEGGIIGVIDGNNGELAGSIGLFLDQYWYSSDFYVCEFWNHIAIPYRKSEYAKNLIDFAKYVSERMKLVLNIGILSTHRTQAKIRLYERRLQPAGAFFFHNLEMAKGPAYLKGN